jgi:hypothetical protein
MEKKFNNKVKNSDCQTVQTGKIPKNSEKKKQMYMRIMNEILTELKINANELGSLLGKKRSPIYDILDPDKKVGISLNMADSICEKFPQFNKSYLLTGEGKMLKSSVNQSNIEGDNIQGNNFTVNKSQIDKLIDLVKTRDEQLNKSQEQIDKLIGIIEKISNN